MERNKATEWKTKGKKKVQKMENEKFYAELFKTNYLYND